jgi:hypothetical protein
MADFSMKADPKHWRQRAQEVRAIAEDLDDQEAKKTMLEIAEAYEQMVVLAKRKGSSESSK